MIKLNILDLFLLSGMLGTAIALSFWQKLELENKLLLAAGRSILQLLMVGSILEFVFELNQPLPVVVILIIMLTIATQVIKNNISKEIKGLFPIVFRAIFVSTLFTLSYTLILIIQPSPWYEPQYLISLMGLILGNAMNSASLAGERLASNIKNNSLEIETYLSLGATPLQAITDYRKQAIRVSLIPTLNNMMVMGLVSLPGIFTGQILAGSPPLEAASYQILILFMIVVTNLIMTSLITNGVYKKFFNENLQLNL
jgi:putative ABC transport system permease protein